MGQDKLFYMQDSRQYVGNSMLWWAKECRGYTCDIRRAEIFTLSESKKRTNRPTDVLWPKDFIDDRISYHVDSQNCDWEIAKPIKMSEAK